MQARRRAQARAEEEENNSPELDRRRRMPQNWVLRNTLLDNEDDPMWALAASQRAPTASPPPPTTASASPQPSEHPSSPGQRHSDPLEPNQSPLALLRLSPARRVGGVRQPARRARARRGQAYRQPSPAHALTQSTASNDSSSDDFVPHPTQSSRDSPVPPPPARNRGGRPRANRGRRARARRGAATGRERVQQHRQRGSCKALEPYSEPRPPEDISSLMGGGGKVYTCNYCGALHWPGEERPKSRLGQGIYTSCCRTGKVSHNYSSFSPRLITSK